MDNKTKKLADNELDPDLYKLTYLALGKTILAGIFLCLCGFIFNYPLKNSIAQVAGNVLSSMRACPVSYETLDVSLMWPRVSLEKPILSGKCFGNDGKNMNLNQLFLQFAFPSFYPPGLRFHAKLEKDTSEINIYPTISITHHLINIKDTELDGPFLSTIMGDKLALKGQVTVDALLTLKAEQLTDGMFHVKSKNIRIPAQSIMDFNAPDLPINNLSLKGTIGADGTIVIENLIIGDANSPIVATIHGTIGLNRSRPQNSNLNLTGDIKFSQKLLEELPIIKVLTGDKTAKDGFYQIEVKGQAGSAMPRFL